MTVFGEVRVVDDVPAAFADLVLDEGPESVALSGGGLALRCYEQLAARDVDWRTVTVFFGDERVVPLGDDDSNEGMARRVLLDRAKPTVVHSMVGLGGRHLRRARARRPTHRARPPRDGTGRAHRIAVPGCTAARRP